MTSFYCEIKVSLLSIKILIELVLYTHKLSFTIQRTKSSNIRLTRQYLEILSFFIFIVEKKEMKIVSLYFQVTLTIHSCQSHEQDEDEQEGSNNYGITYIA